MRRLRERSWHAIDKAFPRPSRILDVGAGTGVDTIHLIRRGHEVVACDPSAAMLGHLAAKAQATAVALPAHCLPARRIGELADIYGQASFDGAVSSFGALNLEPDLATSVAGLGRLVRPGGCLVASLLNRWAVVESLGNLAMLRPARAARRWRGRGTFRAGPLETGHVVRYDTLPAIRRALRPAFEVTHCEALAFASPPPSGKNAVRHRRLLSALDSIDRVVAARWPFNRLGDHLLVTASRV